MNFPFKVKLPMYNLFLFSLSFVLLLFCNFVNGHKHDNSVWKVLGKINPFYQKYLYKFELKRQLNNLENKFCIVLAPKTESLDISYDKETVLYNILLSEEKPIISKEGIVNAGSLPTLHKNYKLLLYPNNINNKIPILAVYQAKNGIVILVNSLNQKPLPITPYLNETTILPEILLTMKRRYPHIPQQANFTIFAPIKNDIYWNKLKTSLERENWEAMMMSHVIGNQVLFSKDLATPLWVKNALGIEYPIIDGVTINKNKKILEFDHSIDIGLVHVIDGPITTMKEIVDNYNSGHSNYGGENTGGYSGPSSNYGSIKPPTTNCKPDVLNAVGDINATLDGSNTGGSNSNTIVLGSGVFNNQMNNGSSSNDSTFNNEKPIINSEPALTNGDKPAIGTFSIHNAVGNPANSVSNNANSLSSHGTIQTGEDKPVSNISGKPEDVNNENTISFNLDNVTPTPLDTKPSNQHNNQSHCLGPNNNNNRRYDLPSQSRYHSGFHNHNNGYSNHHSASIYDNNWINPYRHCNQEHDNCGHCTCSQCHGSCSNCHDAPITQISPNVSNANTVIDEKVLATAVSQNNKIVKDNIPIDNQNDGLSKRFLILGISGLIIITLGMTGSIYLLINRDKRRAKENPESTI